MRRLLFAPSWIARHLLALTLVAVFIRMGIWQFTKGESPQGTMQNLFYGIEWPIFAIFVLYWWFRMIKEALSPPDDSGPQWGVGGRIAPETPHWQAAGSPRMLTAGGQSGAAAALVDDEDEEVIAYNHYLAALYERDARQDTLRAVAARTSPKQLDTSAAASTPAPPVSTPAQISAPSQVDTSPQINGARR
ncbi:hypothetical protein [Frankia sp. AiPa1]|uniref:hypothetical protein n=1 Tax=Frankia sp. AiPa1 TaxID=573492 RepID=UPI00202B77AB|nr:hypothetical protein [Frankia sp. AiPa1]